MSASITDYVNIQPSSQLYVSAQDPSLYTISKSPFSHMISSSINSASSSNYSDSYDDSSLEKFIELEGISGNLMLLKLTRNGVDNIKERILNVRHFSWKFPFIHTEKIKYTEFKYLDKIYNVKTTITALASVLGIKYTSYAELMLKDAIQHG